MSFNGITTDIIAGFCTETDEDHKQTLSLMRKVGYSYAYMFVYSERPNTKAARHYEDDIPENIKLARLNEIIKLQNQLSLASNKCDVGKTFKVLIDGTSKRSNEDFCGRNSQNKTIVFPRNSNKIGDYADVKITNCTSATLVGGPIIEQQKESIFLNKKECGELIEETKQSFERKKEKAKESIRKNIKENKI